MAALAQEKPSQNANDIGWAFVPQYYNFVNKDPARLHCFYTKQSALIHGTEGEEVATCYGQQEIHQKFMSVGFDDCKVFVSTVDSMSSADSGIIVQVLGEMSNANGPWRKFAQTFFLAEQPNGFFVLNDIFRYLKDPEDDVSETEVDPVATKPEATSTPTPPSPSADAVAATDSHPALETTHASQDSTQPEVTTQSDTSLAVPQPAMAEHPKVNGIHSSTVAEASEPTPVVELATPLGQDSEATAPTAPALQTSTAEQAPVPSHSPHEIVEPVPVEVTANNAAVIEATTTSGLASQAPPVTVALNKMPDPPQPAAPKTWASLAASGKSKWSGNLSASQGVSSTPAVQAGTDQRSITPLNIPTASSSGGAGSTPPRRDDRYVSLDAITTGACFVKGVNENVDERVLRETLTKRFGPIKELDIVRAKACAFLEFERADSAKKAIHMSMPHHMGGEGGIRVGPDNHLINIDIKRQPGERGRPADAGPKRGGMGGDRSGPGGRGGPFGGRGRGDRGGEGGDHGSNRGGRGRGGPGRTGGPTPQAK